jgi:arylsulfatase A-like enzyme
VTLLRAVFAFSSVLLLSLAAGAQTPPPPSNILVIIADDVGVDMIGAYQPLVNSNQVPPTPRIDELAAHGVLFRNAWSNPLCATTRATIQTGRYGHRTGIIGPIDELEAEEFAIPELLTGDPALDYGSAVIGKWGLGGTPAAPITRHAVRSGYDRSVGEPSCCLHGTYFNWQKHFAQFTPGPGCDLDRESCITSSVTTSTAYATSENVEDAKLWLGSLPAEQPWLLVLAFNAAHTPFHAPPDALHSYPKPLNCTGTGSTCYRAMIEAMDNEIDDLLDWLGPQELANTTVIFVGDNGSPVNMGVDPFDPQRAKGSLYQGGINVPLIVSGAAVVGPGRVSPALVNTSDLFRTVLELAGANPATFPTVIPSTPEQPWDHDSFSIVPILKGTATDGEIRHYAFAQSGNGKTIRNRRGFKLLLIVNQWSFFDLADDPQEDVSLIEPDGDLIGSDPEQLAALTDLRARLGEWWGDPPNLPAANRDLDADAVAEDGGAAFCTGGQFLGCDDNCPALPNPDQADADGDAIGNACDVVCDNGLDDDGDGYIDVDGFGSAPADPACATPAQNTEKQNCQDGIDNDSDVRKDFDGGQSIHGACSAGVCPPGVSDVNGDGVADPDLHCSSFADNTEQNHCGFGFELALLTPLLSRLERYRRLVALAGTRRA